MAALIVVAAPGMARASYPTNWRVRPTQVLDMGTQGGEPRIRVEGFFAYTSTDFGAPPVARCGAMDFFCRSNMGLNGQNYCAGGGTRCLDQCRQEWSDIAAAARAGTCVTLRANLWHSPNDAVRALNAPFADPDPYDAVMGVATVPCHPDAPDLARPNLPDSCRVGGRVSDAGDLGNPDADGATDAALDRSNGEVDAASTADAAPPPVGSGGSGGGSTGGSGGGAGGRGSASGQGAGCALARTGDHATGLGAVVLVGLVGMGVRRRRLRC